MQHFRNIFTALGSTFALAISLTFGQGELGPGCSEDSGCVFAPGLECYDDDLVIPNHYNPKAII